ncbi:MAG: methionine--tRNA ligase [Thermoplasmata archaeon]|nr:methionine--tRNA ligase [Thermoplasmata archaeon]
MARIFVGVAWPYANGPFHIGHLAGAYLPADLFARFHRLKGDEVLMVSGSDMHGTPILVRAEQEGTTPDEIARRYDTVNREAFRRLGSTYDLFTNTRTIIHEKTVQELFLALLENSFLARKTELNAYCPNHRRFLPDRYLVGTCPNCGNPNARGDECDRCGRVLTPAELKSPRCSLCGTPAEFRPSEHFFLLLDKFQPQLAAYLAERTGWRPNVVGVTRNFFEVGLHPTPITRDLDWGIPLPLDGYETKRFYVWFDALIGYLSASKEWAVRAGKPDAWHRFWDAGEAVRQYYFLGKDNIFYHTIFWPAILLGHGKLQLPFDVPANEWMLLGGEKIAKSRPADADAFIPSLLEHFSPDAIRFYATLLAPENHDTEFDWDEFHGLCDEILANQWGNLVQRVLVLVREKCGGKIPTPGAPFDANATHGVGERLRAAHVAISTAFEEVRLKEAFDRVLTEIRDGNRRFQESAPWRLSGDALAIALYEALWTIRAAAIWSSPVIPFSAAEVGRMLGEEGLLAPGAWDSAVQPPEPGKALGEIRPLFPRRETGTAKRATPSGASGTGTAPAEATPPLAVQTAQIQSAAPHPNADKLYVLTLETEAGATRTVVAGIRPYFSPEELAGRRLMVLTNLAPRTIRGVVSQGMILAGDDHGRPALLEPPHGTLLGAYVDGAGPDAPSIAYEQFEASPLVAGVVVSAPAPGELEVDVGGKNVHVGGTETAGGHVVVQLTGRNGDSGRLLTISGGVPVRPAAGVARGTRIR